MLPDIPYTAQIDDLTVTVTNVYVELPKFTPLAVFSEDASVIARIQGNYTDKISQRTANVSLEIRYSDATFPISQTLVFDGTFKVKRETGISVAYVGIKLGEYCSKLINEYVKESPIKDNDGKLYPIPAFCSADFDFSRALFDV